MFKDRWKFFLVTLVAFLSFYPSPDLHALSSPVDLSGHHVLGNGLDVRLLADRSTPLVAALVLVKAGYATEDATNSGYTHLLEHMVFAGTERRSKEDINREIRNLGGYINGFTRDDYAGYLVVGHRDHLASLLEILSDMLFHSVLDEIGITEAKAVVLEEIRRQQSRPGVRAGEAFQSILYEGSSYARTGLGNERTVSRVTRQSLMSYYRETYRPDNMILLLAGGFSAGNILDVIEGSFGAPDPGGAQSRVLPAPPLSGERIYTITGDLPDVGVSMGFTGPDPRDGDTESLELAASVLGGSGGILELALEAAGLEPRSVAAYLTVNRGFSRFVISASFSGATDPNAALEIILKALRASTDVGLPPQRINDSRETLASGEIMGREKLHYYLMGKAQWAVAGAPGQGFSPGRWDHLSPEDVDNAVKKYLVDRPVVALLTIPQGRLAEPSAPSREGPITRSTLDNGLAVVAEQRPGSEVFALHLMTRRRGSREPEGQMGIVDFLHRMLPMGTYERSREDIESQLRKLGISISTAGNPTVPFGDFYTSRTYSYIRVECVQERAVEAVKLVADMVKNPSFPAERVEEVRSRILDFIAYRDASPEKAASAALADRLYGGVLPRDVLGTEESISSITRADLEAFHKLYLSGRNVVLTVVSGMEPARATELVESNFLDLPPGDEPGDPELPETRHSDLITMEMGKPQGAITVGAVGQPVPKAKLPTLAIVTGLLNEKLSRELREKEGLAYSVGGSLGEVYGRSVFRLSMGTAPEKMDAARTGIRREIEAMRRMKITPDDLNRRTNALTGRLQMRMLSSINRAFYLGLAERSGLGHTFGEDYRRILQSLKPEDVMEAARRYLPEENLIEVVVR